MTLTVEEASETYLSAMRNVLPAGDDACRVCKTFVDGGWSTCYSCGHQENALDEVLPITYSEDGGQMHTALANYKRAAEAAQKYIGVRVLAILWRFLEGHERCLASAVGVERFEVVTTVPSATLARDRENKLRQVVRACAPVSERWEQLLLPADGAADDRAVNAERFVPQKQLDGADVLLIDDTWAKGGHAQSAALALRSAGARHVGLMVIGRHLNPTWEVGGCTSKEIFDSLPRDFDWGRCALCSTS